MTLSSEAGASPAHEQNPELHPNLARGKGTDQRFDADSIAAVNLFNGNLFLIRPLGNAYPVDSRLSYRFALSYNSNVWDYGDSPSGPLSQPLRASNAGLGFDVSFGRLHAPGTAGNSTSRWIYIDPTGASHPFYSDLHWDTPDPDDPGDAYLYTRDGSYYRLHLRSASEATLAFPDGRVHTFTRQAGEWRLGRMGYAGTAAEVAISYAPDGSSWTLVDSHGRTQRLYFRDDPTGHYPRLVDRLELTAFAGATAIYRFAYSVGTVARPCADIQGGQETVPLLTSLIDPMGRELTFGYYTGGAGCESSGRLKQAELDAGGYQRWWYGDYPFPPFDCAGTTPTYFTAVAGVVQKALIKPDGSVLGTWSYQPSLTGGPGCSATERRTTVTTPLGHAETHYFSVATSSAATAGGAADYGLPLTRSADDGHARYLSVSKAGRETYVRFEQDRTCASMLDDCFDTNRRLASQRVLYTDDPVAGGGYRFADTDSADPADAGYRTYRNYEFGALAREGFLDSEGAALPFRHADFDVDPGTGLLAARRVPWARRLCRSTFVCTK